MQSHSSKNRSDSEFDNDSTICNASTANVIPADVTGYDSDFHLSDSSSSNSYSNSESDTPMEIIRNSEYDGDADSTPTPSSDDVEHNAS